ncbi:MAG: glycoside hydrolase [Actinobacteria bacterium]|nr:glycoside hydrolase [Actinomycetota bacterium]
MNGGRTWYPGGSPMLDPHTDCSGVAINGPYATLVFDREGVLYVALVANDPKFNHLERADRPRHVFLARSSDGGRSFDTSMVYEAPEGVTKDPRTNNQRPMVVVDPSDPTHVYVSWLQRGVDTGHKALIAASDDGGRTFAEPVQLSNDEEHGGYQPRPAVGPDGTVHVIFPSSGFADPRPDEPLVRPLYYSRSVDYGRTFDEVRVIDEGNAGFSFMRKQLLAADPSTGTLYAVWYGHPDPRASRPDADADVFVRVSTDGGDTWSERRRINDDRVGVQQYDPGISIAPNGRVDVAWYDFRNSPVPEGEGEVGNAGGYNDVYYASSSDQGVTWSENVRVSDRIIDRTIGVWSNNIHSHTNVGMTSTDNAVFVAWQDTRNGNERTQAEDIYFASILLDGPNRTSVVSAASFDVPLWAVVATSLAVGLGVAMLVAAVLLRRVGPRDARLETTTRASG